MDIEQEHSEAAAAAALLHGLDSDQRMAVTAPESLIAVIAGAGSGKTTVLTRRIAYRLATGVADERHVLVVTFTRQAAGELKRHLQRYGFRSGISAGTFHSIAFALLRQRWADTGRPPMAILRNRTSLLSELANPVARSGRRSATGPSGIDVSSVLAEIDWAKARLVTPGRYATAARAAGRRPGVSSDVVVELFQSYERVKKHRRVVDFDDLLAHCLDELNQDKGFADATRWRYRHLFVDEFQDVNPLQHGLLEAIRANRADLCVVGDPRQSIYGWNGSEPALLEQIGERYPAIRIVRLDRNYRSTPQIVTAAAGVIGSHDLAPPMPVRADGASVLWRPADNETAEALDVADLAVQLRSPSGRWSSTAVLARTNAQLIPIADALTKRGVPVRSAGRQRLRHDPDIAQLLADAKAIAGPSQLDAWAADLEESSAAGIVSPQRLSLAKEVRTFLGDAGGGRSRVDGPAFLDWRVLAEEDEDPADGVELLTFHAAKGRQWISVVVSGVEAGLVPHASAVTEAQRREEARLLYVACTRAQDTLVVTWTQERGGRVTGPSPLIHDAAVTADEPRPPRPHLVHRRPPPPPDKILESLRRWRTKTARAVALPERFVCSDETLLAIAAAKPASADDLGRIEGMSELAVVRFGQRILTAVAQSGSAAQAADPADADPVKADPAQPSPNVEQSG